MIIAKAPLRMSFIGGGTDLPNFYREYGGIVVSSTINRYVYTTINRKFDDKLRVSYSTTENCDDVSELRHPIVRNILIENNIRGGVEITSVADIPSGGTGLGSSSSFAVSLLYAVSAFQGKFKSRNLIAEEACKIEIDLCNSPIGKQDQYASSYGGLNIYKFNTDDTVTVEPVIISSKFKQAFERHIICFYTGRTRAASPILLEQKNNLIANNHIINNLLKMKTLVFEFLEGINNQDLKKMGQILHESWLIKRQLASSVSDAEIDRFYKLAIKNGAWGGKLLGAGGGGFLMFMAPEDCHFQIENALTNLKKVELPLSIDGARVIFAE